MSQEIPKPINKFYSKPVLLMYPRLSWFSFISSLSTCRARESDNNTWLVIKPTHTVEIISVSIVLPVKLDTLNAFETKLFRMKLIFGLFLLVACAAARKLEEKYSWKELDYAWPSEEAKQEAIKSGRYIESHNLPLGLDVWKDKLFITVPR